MDMTIDRKAARLLRRAEELMNEGGEHWTKGVFKRSSYITDPKTLKTRAELSYCAVGAVWAAAAEEGLTTAYNAERSNDVVNRAITALAQRIKEAGVTRTYDNPIDTVTSWNDNSFRTFDEVRSMFRNTRLSLKR